MKLRNVLLSSIIMLSFALMNGCVEQTDLVKEKEALLNAHRKDRAAHFGTDVQMLLEHQGDDFISISNGKIERLSKQQIKDSFTSYFKNAVYYEWDDLEEPIVKISGDGSIAWMINRYKVERKVTDHSGKEEMREFVYAGVTLYEKENGIWVRKANVSTFE